MRFYEETLLDIMSCKLLLNPLMEQGINWRTRSGENYIHTRFRVRLGPGWLYNFREGNNFCGTAVIGFFSWSHSPEQVSLIKQIVLSRRQAGWGVGEGGFRLQACWEGQRDWCSFCKAFDTVPHRSLIDKLHNLKLSHHIITWIHNYLANWKCVVVNGLSLDPW